MTGSEHMKKRKPINPQLFKGTVPKYPTQLVWLALVTAVVFTALINCVQCIIWYGHIRSDLLIIGTIDAIAVVLIVAPIAIHFGLLGTREIEKELRALTLADDLTKLNNRRGFFLLAEHVLKISSRTRTGVYLMYTDLDDFKVINDKFGHIVGDHALQEYARLLKESYRGSDVIARIGGDEFVLIPVGTSNDSTDTIINRHHNILTKFNNTNQHPWKLKASIGLAFFDPDSPCSLDELINLADKSLYQDKKE